MKIWILICVCAGAIDQIQVFKNSMEAQKELEEAKENYDYDDGEGNDDVALYEEEV